ncbi:glycosyltransferase [Cryobacterium algoritolerans]|uniref:Glycosyltransferase n=1 Tax=Cryobacterium algoritolerans TaxID=1259184 RepID=A0A4R8WLP9_9MICO|nr:glycosyltransferase [Cryobacterium algoritolerans]TFC10422.1 glycosyltransferase [Cryobacterium algoritolerans]
MAIPLHTAPARVRRQVRRLLRASAYEVYAFWRRRPVDPDVVLYESFGGNGMLCNPEAIFRGLRAAPDFGHLKHVWVLSDKSDNASVVREFASDAAVRFVSPGSQGYYRALATSGYLVNNATFPTEFSKRPQQVYLNTWHGTPLKRMGYDIGDPASRVANVIRNFLSADYLLAANRFMVEQMYEKAHLLRNIYRGEIIEEGYPRIDAQFTDVAGVNSVRDRLEAAGLPLTGRKIILYAPTWKGESFARPNDDAEELIRRVIELETLIDTSQYVVLLKTHQVVHQFAARRKEFRGRLVPNEIPTNSVLSATDILVTDYSSTFFDFLSTGRPIAFLTPDIDDYAGYRGLYMEPEEWPGPVVRTVAELAVELNVIARSGQRIEVAEGYAAMQEKYAAHEDGHATDRIIDIVFRGKRAGYRVGPVARDDRRSILINVGGMTPNGITSSALNLLNAIDHSKFDVSVVFPYSRRPRVLEKQAEINPAVRQFARVGGMSGSKITHAVRRVAWFRGDLSAHEHDPVQERLWDDEWTRCFGSSRFDFAIDFSGYGQLWATLMLHAPGAERSIWLHNDMAADAQRNVHGKRRQFRSLTGVFSLYRGYDHLVSVSPALAAINAHALDEYASVEKFVAAKNLVNAPHILRAAKLDVRQAATDITTGVVPGWATDLTAASAPTTFVTAGRLSPEKNHARMIRAFAAVHSDHPETRLIIVGDGPLYEQLSRLITELGLSTAIVLTGHQHNPYAVMAASDCFVLSSDYEGQPMVLLEALILDLPVVTVAFGSAGDALPTGVGLTVPATDDGLADGMRAFLRGEVPTAPFDNAAYNQDAMEQFYVAIGTAQPRG